MSDFHVLSKYLVTVDHVTTKRIRLIN